MRKETKRAVDRMTRDGLLPDPLNSCTKCGAPAPLFTTGAPRTFTLPPGWKGFLIWLCPSCFEAEDGAWEAWCDRQSDPGLN
jgi:hypothetical protein